MNELNKIIEKIEKHYFNQKHLEQLKKELTQVFLDIKYNCFIDLFKHDGREWVLSDVIITWDWERKKPLIYIKCRGLSKKEIGATTNYICYVFLDSWYNGRLPFYVRDKDSYCFLDDIKRT